MQNHSARAYPKHAAFGVHYLIHSYLKRLIFLFVFFFFILYNIG